jgi:lipid-A-disaccharide synthase
MRLFFSVGDPSGDHHAAQLISQLRTRCDSLECTGYGGPLMREAGANIDFELTNLSVMGVGAVIPLLGKFVRLYRQAGQLLRQRRPDAVVLVDYPGFNWWVAKAARRVGIPVIYYMPPQLWAWAPWRIRKVRKYVDLVLSPLPFEAEWYQHRGVETRYVGHPFLDAAHDGGVVWRNDPLEGDLGKRVLMLPGSRRQEVARNFPVMLSVMHRIAEHHPEARFHVACHKEEHRRSCAEMLAASGFTLPITLHAGRTQEAIDTCDMALMVSGSVSLELLKAATPAVVLYKCGWMTAALGSLLTRCQYISLPNLIAGREIMPEFVFLGRDAVHIDGMATILRGWLEAPSRLAAVQDELVALRESLRVAGNNSASAQAAEEVVEFVETKSRHRKDTLDSERRKDKAA